ncbi:unnamed protein product [Phyllotreta striolata]|uniref:Protein sleepless n=1 Tax=Phyllotreta striolata TaxID=444603 RepID=A0A9N9THP8_PHYSR|nr:unnamed protein product [Phyllotreta striolata]
MMKLIVVILFAITVAITIASDDPQPTKCYHCSLIEGEICNKPDFTWLGVQSCDDIPTNKNTTDKVVCYTVTATWLGQPITERGCYYQEMEGMDLCTYFNKTEANVPFTFDYKCKLCYNDLCNGLPSR